MLEVFDNRPEKNDIRFELIYSEDGYNWERPFRNCDYIDRNTTNKWDWGVQFIASILEDDQDIKIYYGGMNAVMDEKSMAECQSFGVGVAKVEKDMFCGLKTLSHKKGSILFKPFYVEKSIHIKVKVETEGYLIYQLKDVKGNIVKGFSFDECIKITRNEKNYLLRWNNTNQLKSGEYIIEIEAFNACLYSVDIG